MRNDLDIIINRIRQLNTEMRNEAERGQWALAENTANKIIRFAIQFSNIAQEERGKGEA